MGRKEGCFCRLGSVHSAVRKSSICFGILDGRWRRDLSSSSMASCFCFKPRSSTPSSTREFCASVSRPWVPDGVEVPDEATALRMIGKSREAADFIRLANATLAAFPELGDWLARRPLTALDYVNDWPRVLAVLEWFRDHPRPGLYLRQLDIPGVDTKFIETHKGLLTDLLSLVLPPEAVDTAATGVKGFEQRFGLLSKPPLVRFRILDPVLALGGLTDLTVPADELVASPPPGRLVFITENEINGLSFPLVPDAIVIFGLGHGIGMLNEFSWMHRRQIYYWSDIDTHGFAMLNRLRMTFPHTQSMLMDRATLLEHRTLWSSEDVPHSGEMNNLTVEESAMLEDLRCDRLGKQIRMEQERVNFCCLREWLKSSCAETIT